MTLILNGTTGVSGVDGSAATPAFQGNDANTGISFGTDIVTINTGGVARVTTNASGNVGINETNPTQKLHVGGNILVTSGGTIFSSGQLYVRSGAGQSLDFGSNDVNSRMILDSSGNVGIGTTSNLLSAASRVTVSINGASSAALAFGTADTRRGHFYCDSSELAIASAAGSINFQTAGNTQATIDASGNVGIGVTPTAKLDVLSGVSNAARITTSSTGSYGALIITNTNTNSESSIGFRDSSDTAELQWTIGKAVGGISDAFGFYYNGSVRTLIDSSGNLLVGTTSVVNASKMSVSFVAGSGRGIGVSVNSTSSYGQMSFNNPNGEVGGIATSGTTTSFNTSSDYRLKENVAPMQNALATVAALKPCTYTWKADGSAGQGFIAHELQEVVPDCVTGTKDAVDAEGNPQYQGVDTSFLVATLVAAIQELKNEVDALKGAQNV